MNKSSPEMGSDKIDVLENDWFPEVFGVNWMDYVETVLAGNEPKSRTKGYEFYTSVYKYSIRAVDRYGKKGYLGCSSSTRKNRAGEGWNRGNDLPDGPFNKDTWNSILRRIIKYEAVPLSPDRHPDHKDESKDSTAEEEIESISKK